MFDTDIAWEVRVLVSGIHSDPGGPTDGQAVIGAAALLFSLELYKDTVEGTQVSMPGYAWSSGAASVVEHAFVRPIFDLNDDRNPTGSLFSLLSADGPGLSQVQYPSVFEAPVGATTNQGVLARMGAAYTSYDSSQQAAGVGLTRPITDCRSLGAVPVFEGQIMTWSLPPDTYTLKCVPHVGNVLLDSSRCNTPAEGTTLDRANEVFGDTITFEFVPSP